MEYILSTYIYIIYIYLCVCMRERERYGDEANVLKY